MSRYYNVYQSTKKKSVLPLVIGLLISAAVLAFVIVFVLVPFIKDRKAGGSDVIITDPEGEDDEEEETEILPLRKPVSVQIDSTMTELSWYCPDNVNTVGYRVMINGVEQNVYQNPYTVNLTEGVFSDIKVKALGDNKAYSDSEWSDPLSVYKEDAEHIAYASVFASVTYLIERNVRISVGGVSQTIKVTDLIAVDYEDYSADIWYAYAAGEQKGMARTTVRMPQVGGLVDYKGKLDQIETTITNYNLDTQAYPYLTEAPLAVLQRSELPGTVATLKIQNAALSQIIFGSSPVTVADGTATVELLGIVKSVRNSNVKYYVCRYTASTSARAGYTGKDYLDSLGDPATVWTFAEPVAAAEMSSLAKEMLVIGDAKRLAYEEISASVINIIESENPVDVIDLIAIDYQNGNAVIWYAYTDGAQSGIARATVKMPQVAGLFDYQSKIAQIETTIGANETVTVSYPFTSAGQPSILQRESLPGTLASLKQQSVTLTQTVSCASSVSVSAGRATVEIFGIVKAANNSSIKFYAYHFIAATTAHAGYSDADYIASLLDEDADWIFAEAETTEMSMLAKETILMRLLFFREEK